jgi:acetyl esterase/lipase
MIKLIPNFEDVVIASVEYRLAPAHRAPAAAYDCYAALVYLADHSSELGIDASRILVYGTSGGAAPAAATCILARDRQYPPIRAQVLSIPMIDDRDHYRHTNNSTLARSGMGRRTRKPGTWYWARIARLPRESKSPEESKIGLTYRLL